jgi:hypothetical protein
VDPDADLRAALELLSPRNRELLRRVLVRDHADRDEIAQHLLRFGDQNSRDWADVIDALTLDPEHRRRVVRLLAEIDAAG